MAKFSNITPKKITSALNMELFIIEMLTLQGLKEVIILQNSRQ